MKKQKVFRTDARETMMKVYYQMDLMNDFDVDSRSNYLRDLDPEEDQTAYCEELYSLLCNKKEEIDRAITDHSRKWSISRMPKTDLAVLRLAVCEILFLQEVPDSVAINEAVELAKRYGEENSPKYVNGILGAVAREKAAAAEAAPAEDAAETTEA